MKANILTLVIALLGLSFLGIHYGSKLNRAHGSNTLDDLAHCAS